VRLADLDPAAVGREAVDRILRRVQRLALPLSPGVDLRVTGGLNPDPAARPLFLAPAHAASGIALTVADLTRYAQSGDVSDWGSPAGAEDALLTIGEALWSRPIDATAADGWTVDDLRAALASDDEPDDPVRLAIGCAVARWVVWRGEAITTGELAALAGVTPDAVRQAIKRAQLAATNEPRGRATVAVYPADEVRRWLGARGAAGWR
jgi:hypothetical protein